jgi:hypothetical protein
VSVDRRARDDGPLDIVDPGAFFGCDLPAILDARADLLAPALAWYRPRPLAIACGGGRWLLAARAGRITVAEGSGRGAAELALTPGQLTELVADLVTPLRWFGEGDGTGGPGGLGGAPLDVVLDWWVLLRGAIDGTVPYVPGTDPAVVAYRPFRGDDDPAAMAAFLEATGYLHLAGLFTAAEMAGVSADIDRAAPRPGTGGRSDRSVPGGGHGRVTRVLGFDAVSPGAGAVLADDRLAMIGRLTGDGHTLAAYARPGIEALVKPPGAPGVAWHKDCGFGRHSYDCASLTVGVAVTDADRGSGHLRVLAGSHRELVWPAFVHPGTELPAVDILTRAGDVTVHLSCTAHMARPPVRAERRVLYTAFGLPPHGAGTGTSAPSAGVA